MTKHINPAQVRGIVAVRADTSGDITALIEGVNKGFEEFKAATVEKDKEIAARFDDVVTTDKIDKIEASLGDLQGAIDTANAKIAAAEISGGADPVKDAEYTESFRAHFRKGDVSASLNKGADDEGGYLAPVEWDRSITSALIEESPMRQIAGSQTISKAGFTKLFNLRGTGSGWVDETGGRPETSTPQFDQMVITPGELYAMPGATQGMLDDAEINLESWIAGEVQTEFAQQEGLAFVSGNGDNKPSGFLTYAEGAANAGKNPLGPIKVIQAAAANTVTEDELLDLIYAVPSTYTMGSRFVMNRTTMGVVRKLRDSDGRQLWQPSSALGEPSTLLNYAATEMPDMPQLAANATGIAFGNFQRGYLIVDRMGVRILRDPYTAKPKILFYTTKRVGGAVVDPTGLKVLKQAAS